MKGLPVTCWSSNLERNTVPATHASNPVANYLCKSRTVLQTEGERRYVVFFPATHRLCSLLPGKGVEGSHEHRQLRTT
jgi:hypothetical protein